MNHTLLLVDEPASNVRTCRCASVWCVRTCVRREIQSYISVKTEQAWYYDISVHSQCKVPSIIYFSKMIHIINCTHSKFHSNQLMHSCQVEELSMTIRRRIRKRMEDTCESRRQRLTCWYTDTWHWTSYITKNKNTCSRAFSDSLILV